LKTTFFIILLTCSYLANGQTFDKKYFTKTDWYTDNNLDVFYKSDTIKLFKHNICDYPVNIKTYCESESKFFKHGNIVQIVLGKRSKMKLTNKHGNGWSLGIDQKWWIDNNKNLVLKDDKKNVYKFKIDSSRQVNVPTDYATETLTTELTLIRLKTAADIGIAQ